MTSPVITLALSHIHRRRHSRYDDIFAKLGGDVEAARAMGPLLSAIGGNFVTPEAAAELEALFAAHSCASLPALTACSPAPRNFNRYWQCAAVRMVTRDTCIARHSCDRNLSDCDLPESNLLARRFANDLHRSVAKQPAVC